MPAEVVPLCFLSPLANPLDVLKVYPTPESMRLACFHCGTIEFHDGLMLSWSQIS